MLLPYRQQKWHYVADVAREAQTGRKATEACIAILEDLCLAFRLPVFRKRQKRQLVAHPKVYWFDAGVFRSARPAGPFAPPEEIDGGALEGLVAQHPRAWVDTSRLDRGLSYWRTKSGNEVDFVVYGEDGLWAFEVKNGATVRERDLRGLRAFLEDYPEAEARLLYRGTSGWRCAASAASRARRTWRASDRGSPWRKAFALTRSASKLNHAERRANPAPAPPQAEIPGDLEQLGQPAPDRARTAGSGQRM